MVSEILCSVSDSNGNGGDVRMKYYEDRVLEWEDGLPRAGDLPPLSQPLIPPELAAAFSVTAEPYRSMFDVNRASQNTMSSLRRQNSGFSSNNFKSLHSFMEDRNGDPLFVEGDEHYPKNSTKDVLEKRNLQRLESAEEADLVFLTENSNDDHSVRPLKRPRLVWTPQLHKRFVDVVAHLGINNAVPKTIMELMNVEGLSRENVASHLQKYRLYLKRMQDLSDEGPSISASDQLFGSTPVPQGLHESSGSRHMPPPLMPYWGTSASPPMPVLGMAHGHGHGHGHLGIPVGNPSRAACNGFQFHPYNVFSEQQRDWSGYMFGSIVPYHHGAPNDKYNS